MQNWCSFVNFAARQTVAGFSFSRLTNTRPRIHLGMASSHILLTTIFIIASSIIHTKGLKCYTKMLAPTVQESPPKEKECYKSNTQCLVFDGLLVSETEEGKQESKLFYQDCNTGDQVFNCTKAGPEYKELYMNMKALVAKGNLKCCKEDLCNKGEPSAVEAKPAEGKQGEKAGDKKDQGDKGSRKEDKGTTHKAGDKEVKGGQKTSKIAGTKEATKGGATAPKGEGTKSGATAPKGEGTKSGATTPKGEGTKSGATTAKSEEDKSGATTPKSEGVGAKVWILTLGGMMVVACIF